MEHHGGVDVKRYEAVYRMLLHDTFERLPNVKVMLLEPFALKASATEEIWDTFESEVLLRAEAVKRLSDEFNLTFIPLQEKLREAWRQRLTDNPDQWQSYSHSLSSFRHL